MDAIIYLITLFILGVLISSSCIVIWFETNLAADVFKTLKISNSNIYTFDEWSNDMIARFPFFGELLSCPLCLSVWTSCTVSAILTLVNELSWWFVPACTFSWPIIIFMFYTILTESD